MRSLYLFALSFAALMIPAFAAATPVEYSFEMTVTQLRTYERPDPHYSVFSLGQKFLGGLTYDPDGAIQHDHPGYHNVMSLWFQWGETRVSTDYPADDPLHAGATVTLVDFRDGAGEGDSDTIFFFEEWPRLDGGYFAKYVLDVFYFYLDDYQGTALSSNGPAAIDFSRFDGGTWGLNYFGRESTYSPLYMAGLIGNFTQVPEPSSAALMGFALLALTTMSRRRRIGWRSNRGEMSALG